MANWILILSRPIVVLALTFSIRTAVNLLLGSPLQNYEFSLTPGCPSTLNNIQLCNLTSFEGTIPRLALPDIIWGVGLESINGLGSFRATDVTYDTMGGRTRTREDNNLTAFVRIEAQDNVTATTRIYTTGLAIDLNNTLVVDLGTVGASMTATVSVDCNKSAYFLTIDDFELEDVSWLPSEGIADIVCPFGVLEACTTNVVNSLDVANDLFTNTINFAIRNVVLGILPNATRILPRFLPCS